MRQREPLIVPSHCLDQILLLVRGVCNVIKPQVEEREGGDGDDDVRQQKVDDDVDGERDEGVCLQPCFQKIEVILTRGRDAVAERERESEREAACGVFVP